MSPSCSVKWCSASAPSCYGLRLCWQMRQSCEWFVTFWLQLDRQCAVYEVIGHWIWLCIAVSCSYLPCSCWRWSWSWSFAFTGLKFITCPASCTSGSTGRAQYYQFDKNFTLLIDFHKPTLSQSTSPVCSTESVPRHWLSTFGRRAVTVAVPTVWNSATAAAAATTTTITSSQPLLLPPPPLPPQPIL